MAELFSIARPYAQAVFELARSNGDYTGWSQSLGAMAQVSRDREMKRLIQNPRVSRQEIAQVIADVSGSGVGGEGRNLLRLLAQNRRLHLQPANADHYGNRGAAYGSLGRHVDAIRDFSAAIELAPNESLHYVGRGQGYLELSQVARADADFESAIDLNSINPTAYAFRAVSQSLLGDHVAAAAAANRAEELGFPGGLIGTLITAYTEQISANDK